jgi:hypothetical protein
MFARHDAAKTTDIPQWHSISEGEPSRQISRNPMLEADPKLSAVKTESNIHLVKDLIRDTRCGSVTSQSL